jgi:hypothetical protein
VSENNSIIHDVGSGEIEEEPCYADTLNLLRQTRGGGYVGKKGINIETSPDAVIFVTNAKQWFSTYV